MTSVRVRTIGLLKALIRQGEFDLELPDNGTVQDALDAMAHRYGPQVAAHLTAPADATSHPPLRVMVNGRDIAVLEGRETVLAEADDILVLTPIAGG